MFDRRIVLGVPVDNLTMETTLECILGRIEDNSNNLVNYIATVNVDFIVNTLEWSYQKISDPILYAVLKSSFLVTADGMPLVWASRFLGNPISGRVTGSDLIPSLAAYCAEKKKSLFLLGGREDVNQKAVEILKKKNPNLIVAGNYAPPIKIDKKNPLQKEDSDDTIIETINSSNADILLIALGNPKQEYWYYKNADRLKPKVVIGIGGTLDFISGNIKRAPIWMQKTGFEWVYRFLQEPSRMWKRYTRDIALFLSLIVIPILYFQYRKFFTSSGKTDVDINLVGDNLHIALAESFNQTTTNLIFETLKNQKVKKITFDFTNTKLIDNLSLAYLFHLNTFRKSNQITIEFKNVNSIVRNFFHLNRLMPEFSELILS